jgi:hypothetical protein
VTFTVSVVVEGVTLTDDEVDALYRVLPDAMAARIDDAVTIGSPVEALHGVAAARRLVGHICQALPQAVPVRLDQDLVSIPDSADRVGRTRESVRLLVEHKRGPGGFPAPVGVVGDAIRVWPWAVVLGWFVDVLGEDLDEDRGVTPDEAALVDAWLVARRRDDVDERRGRSAGSPQPVTEAV